MSILSVGRYTEGRAANHSLGRWCSQDSDDCFHSDNECFYKNKFMLMFVDSSTLTTKQMVDESSLTHIVLRNMP